MTQCGQSVATPEWDTARADLGHGPWHCRGVDCQASFRSKTRQNCCVSLHQINKELMLIISNQRGVSQVHKHSETVQPDQTQCPFSKVSLQLSVFVLFEDPPRCHYKPNENVQVPHRKREGTLFNREGTVQTTQPLCCSPV